MKSGFVSIIGRSNVGKSTLLNSLVGSKIAITTPKAQTTRHNIQGVLTEDRGQIVFIDTPGVLQKKDVLTKKLLNKVKESLKEIEVVVYVVDPTRSIGDEERQTMRLISELRIPKILVINKIDEKRKPYLEHYRDIQDQFDYLIELSALQGTHIGGLKDLIFELLPEGEMYYPDGQLTNLPNDFWIAELIREKLFMRLRQELPYQTHVEVDEMEDRDDMYYISARILTLDERHKRMIIGAGARGVKEIGQSTRKELEAVMGKKIYLDLQVEVDKHWLERFD
jgi:GTPase